MGVVNCETGNLSEALDSYESCIKIRRKELGNNHLALAQVLNNIGSVFARNKEYERALKPWNDAIDVYRSHGMEDDERNVSCTLNNITLSKCLKSPAPVSNRLLKVDVY